MEEGKESRSGEGDGMNELWTHSLTDSGDQGRHDKLATNRIPGFHDGLALRRLFLLSVMSL